MAQILPGPLLISFELLYKLHDQFFFTVLQSSPFHKAVDLATVPKYMDYIFNPMDLTTLEKVRLLMWCWLALEPLIIFSSPEAKAAGDLIGW